MKYKPKIQEMQDELTQAVYRALARGRQRFEPEASPILEETDLEKATRIVLDSLWKGVLAQMVLEDALDLSFVDGKLHFTLNAKGVEMGLDSILEDKPKH